METLDLLGVALGLATLAGINLYLTVFVTGLAIRFDWIHLLTQYEQLEVLAHPVVIIISGLLYFLEFFADKIPWVDSTWDTLHTIIRPVGGTLLAIQVLGDSDPVFEVIVALLAGGMALMTHSVKAGTRVVVNSSPEPFTNIALSVTEDVTVVGGLWLIYANPVLALVIFVLFLAVASYFAPRMFRAVRTKLWLAWQKLQAPPTRNGDATLPDHLPAGCDLLFHALNESGAAIEWAVPCINGKSPGIPSYLAGFLIATTDDSNTLYFVASRRFGKASVKLDLCGYKVEHSSKFLTENILLYPLDKKQPRYLFLLERPRDQVAKALAQAITTRLTTATKVESIETPAMLPI